ncbi:pirin family protein [Gallicola sp. Sow4_E12]|uniref:pirin family protein n=1 Tax=Gallicola sp. Sow4_E12 TaxID=3438785 RepID=UPI003F90FFC9
MSDFRKIDEVLKGSAPHWVGNGFRVKQFFPKDRGESIFERTSPFLLLHYNEPYYFQATPFETGVGPHPHRGFETVTFSLAGKVEHGDNKGNTGVINPGDIQWMTAGSGILHKEYHENEFVKKDRVFHVIQLWVNLPAKDKMTEPNYQAITKDQMGKYSIPEEGGEVIIYAGEAYGVKGPAKTFSPINIYKINLKKGTDFRIQEPEGFNTGFLVIGGEVEINKEATVEFGNFVLFDREDKEIAIQSIEEESEIMVFSGEPLNEPVAAAGPFVMNTREELVEASRDFREGVFASPIF